ncbi:MAG TPA: hypothetical protein VHE61_08230 [Opitutaceae bacterium]|nr:hypothetical protein [Opitutaceae bacterium]
MALPSSRCLRPAAVIGLALAFANVTPGAADNAAPAPSTYTLYLGADVAVMHGGAVRRIIGVAEGALLVDVDGRTARIPLVGAPLSFRIENALRLGRHELAVERLKTGRAYTPAADPHRKFAREVGAAGAAAADLSLATSQYVQAVGSLNLVEAGPASPGREAAIASASAAAASAGRTMQSAALQSGSDRNSPGFHAMRLQEELDQQLFDAMEISFEISSNRHIEHPYFIAITRFHERDAKPGEFRNWIYAEPLEPLDAQPRKYRRVQGGLPAGYEIDSIQLHVYDRGEELPTSVSTRRMVLTREEAFQYILLDYLSTHPHDTLPPTPALAEAPAALRARASAHVATFYVKVTREGLPAGVFADQQCTAKLGDANVAALVATMFFHPGLEAGKPVDAVLAMTTRDVPR